MAGESPPPLHELESAVMEVVWEQCETTVRAVLESLNAGWHAEPDGRR